MKTLVACVILLSSMVSFAQVNLADQNTVDQWVGLATKMPADKMNGKGKYVATYVAPVNVYGEDIAYKGIGKNRDEAISYLMLQCIRHRCGQVGQWIQGYMTDYLPGVNDEDLADYLQGLGLEPEIQARVLANRKTQDSASHANMTCITGTPLSRVVVYDTCWAQPVRMNR